MRVLVACEESQVVTIAFRKRGHEAYSCDLLPCSGRHPEWHLQQDVIPLLTKQWDLMIAHPPCTHLTCSGARYFYKKQKDGRQQQGIDFFMIFANCNIHKVAIENPVGIMSRIWRKPDQIIQPYNFGDPFQKTTCLWLKNLPKLKREYIEAPLFRMKVDKGEFITFASGRVMPKWYAELGWNKGFEKSKTFPSIAKAMAEQWG